jgi:hypothetical protein
LGVETREPRTFRRVIELTPQEKAAKALRAAQVALKNRQTRPTKAQRKAEKRAKKSAEYWAAKRAKQAISKAQTTAKPAYVQGQWFEYRAGLVGAQFYRTREWAQARHNTLAKYGAICQCCGTSRASGAVMHVDHIKPRSKYPHLELDESNLQVLCELCNIGKSNTLETDWRQTGLSSTRPPGKTG